MKFTTILFVLFVAIGYVICEEEIKLDEGVLVLTKDNFKAVTTDNEHILVEFYAPWCGHCKSLAPEYAKAAQSLAEKGSKVKLGKVDATEEQELAEEYGVRGYPTLKFFRSGSPIEYNGGRTADEIISWLTKKTGPPATELNTVEETETLLKENPVVVVGFFKDRESEQAKAFLAAAGAIDDYPFGITSSEEVYAKYEAKCGSIVLFKHFDDKKAIFDGEFNIEAIKKFVTAEAMPLVVDFNHDSAQKIFGGEIKSHLLMFLSKEAGHIEKYAEPAKEVAKLFRDKILFVSINADEEDHQRILEFFGMRKDEVPSMRIIKLEEDMAKFRPENDDLAADNLQAFVQKFIDGKLKQHLLSQDLPEDWDKAPVKVLVSSNFDEVAFNSGKDVLVEFYAPWCGHCKQLAPIYDQLGEKYKDSDSVIIAKFDATANELEHTKITSFPTLKFYRASDNAVVNYNGERTFDHFVLFIESGGKYGEDGSPMDEENKVEEEGAADGVKDEL